MAIFGMHALMYSTKAEATRTFFRDVLDFPAVDAGRGWLIFAAPPTEVAIHPAEDSAYHELYLMCDDIDASVAELKQKGVITKPIQEQPWGRVTQIVLPSGEELGLYEPRHQTAIASVQSLRFCEAELRKAQLESDVAALERLLDETLVFTGPDGVIYRKQDDLNAHRNGMIRITRLEPSDEHQQLFGSVAVVSVRMEMTGSFRGAPFAGPFRYTRVWRERPEGWRVVSGHVSAVLPTSKDTP